MYERDLMYDFQEEEESKLSVTKKMTPGEEE